MKKSILLLFAALLPLVASAEKVEINGIWYNLVSKAKQAEVTFKGDDPYQGGWYSGSITIPATVTHNGVEYSVTSIGDYAFVYSSLTDITLPEGVTRIGENAFQGCSSLTDITIPEGVTSIEREAFYQCSRLTSITLPESVTSIGDQAFYECSRLTAITLPESVTSIGNSTFRGCSSLTDITFPESVTSIGDDAFSRCSSLTAINIPESVTSIGYGAFRGCSSLTDITLPEGVTSIGNYTFMDCRSLTAITIPEGVTRIGENAFQGCSSLTTIVLPRSVGYISYKAFADCPELTDVYCYAEDVPSTGPDVFDGSFPEYATLHVPAGAINSYKATAPWSSFGNIVELGAAITRITLDKTSAILTEGEELTINITTTPSNADRNLISWGSSNPSVATVDDTGKVTAVAPGIATITATANDGSGVSDQCVVEVKEKLLGKCATPTISYMNGKVKLTCETEGAEVMTNIEKGDDETHKALEFDLIPTYTLTAYATKAKYEDSDEVTLTICWVPCDKNHEGETTGILTIPAKPVLISTQGGTITVSGLAAGTAVAAYSTAGTELATATVTDGTATLTTGLEAGSIAIIKIGDYSIKVAIK